MGFSEFLNWIRHTKTEAEFSAQITLMGLTAPKAGSPLNDFRDVLIEHVLDQPNDWTVPPEQIPPGRTPPARMVDDWRRKRQRMYVDLATAFSMVFLMATAIIVFLSER